MMTQGLEALTVRVHSQQHNRRLAQGFTLIELLVVMTIIAIAASAVSLLSSSNTPAKQLDTEAKRLLAQLSLVSDEAIFDGREVGVEFFRDGYRFFIWEQPDPLDAVVGFDLTQAVEEAQAEEAGQEGLLDEENQEQAADTATGEWLAHPDPIFKLYELPEGMQIYLEVEEEELILEDLSVLEEEGTTELSDEEEEVGPQPNLYILSSGEMSPFALELYWENDYDRAIEIRGNLLGQFERVTDET